jgi:proteasome accessory factor C
MPKQEIDAEDLFNLSLSIVGLVLKDGPMLSKDLAEHFGFSEKTIVRAVKTIANSEDIGRYETHFYVDEDLLEKGEVDFSAGMAALRRPPILSKRQTTALAAGLDFLAALPQFVGNTALSEIRSQIGSGTTPITALAPPERQATLQIIQRALLEKTQLVASYVNQLGEKSERIIDPLRVDFVGRRHYLRGWCNSNQAVRSFRLDRITNVENTDKPISQAAQRADIPLEVFGQLENEITVEIQATQEASEIFWNFPAFDIQRDAEGNIIGKIQVGNLRALGRHVSRYAGQVRVISPSSAVATVRQFALNAISDPSAPEDQD